MRGGGAFCRPRTTFCQVLKLQTTTSETVSPRLASWLLSPFTAGRWNLSVVCLSVSRSMIPSFEEVWRAFALTKCDVYLTHTHTHTHVHARTLTFRVSLIRYQSNRLPYFGEASFLSLIFHTGFVIHSLPTHRINHTCHFPSTPVMYMALRAPHRRIVHDQKYKTVS